ncbi:MAG TPA: PilN domain-containing protein [Polyangiaceae bacterium]|nr:PilN domain-containing protein [Polyangiaceae bacterium]
MIRINLLSRKKRTAEAPQKTQVWLLVALGCVLVEVVVLVILHGLKTDELRAQERRNSEVSAQIEQSKRAVQSHDAVKQKLALLRAREEAIAKLESARSGPTSVLVELSRILTPGRGPSVDASKITQIRRDDPGAAFNPNWDTRRLWLTSFREEKRRMHVDGLARDGEDVSEFARRLSLSDFFQGVKLLPAHRQVDAATKVDLVQFSLEAEVKY